MLTRSARIRGVAALCAAALVVTMTACGSSGTTSSSSTGSASPSTRQGTLTIGATATPSLDPTAVAPPYFWPVYDTPIFQSADGTYTPSMATKWGYSGTANDAFQFTLREGMKFSDGTEVTPDAVVASMKRFLATPGPVAVSAGPVEDVTVEGTDTVVIHYTQAVPLEFAILSLTQNHSFGAIVGPKGLADEASLGTAPDGVGAYTLDAAATTSGSVYTFVPNENYYNQAAIHYEKVVIRTIADQASLLAAVQTGQINYDTSLANNAAATATAAGLNVVTQEGSSASVMTLQSWTQGPLADVRVRQAISHAIPRTDIIAAALGGQGKATSSVGIDGTLGYDEKNVDPYPYDVEKAKSLLAEAGYANGFTLKAIAQEPADSTLAQAVAAALEQVGITMDITINSGTFPEFVAALQGKQFDVSFGSNPSLDVYSLVNFTLAAGGTNNAFSGDLSDINTKLAEAAAVPEDEQAAAFAGVTDAIDQLAIVVPIALGPNLYAVSKNIQNVPTSFPASYFLINPFSPDATESWYGS